MLVFQAQKKLQNLFRLLGVVTFVRLGHDFAVGRGKGVLAGGASHINSANLGAVTFGPVGLRGRDLNAARRLQKRRDLYKSLVGHEDSSLLTFVRSSFSSKRSPQLYVRRDAERSWQPWTRIRDAVRDTSHASSPDAL